MLNSDKELITYQLLADSFRGAYEKTEDRMEDHYYWGSLSFGLLPSINFTDKIEVELFHIAACIRLSST